MPRNKRNRKGRNDKDRVKRTKEEWEEMKKQNPDLGQNEYKLAARTNATFEKFYKGIGIVPEDEWETFLETMRTYLPATFRITGSRSQAQELLKIIKGQYFTKFLGSDELSTKSPQPIPWYPDELAWQMDLMKKQIKNDANLKGLHQFLISETESGNISRQEAVSMIPPLLLDIKPHHKILDMCAAPGSKTAQLIEMLHSDENQPIPEGFVVANDMDNKRCYLMTHQVKRIQSPNCMIINHDARILPNMSLSTDENAEFLKYDRILCDVPCSGDGTMRKNPDIWSKWHVHGGYNLHRIQKKVLQRGLELLAVGGRLVYSTCSLNPVEDEAVILTLIKQCKGAVELVDVSGQLPGLKYCKGTYSWKIMAKDGTWYETVDQAPAQFKGNWDSSMYPPLITEAQEAKLERCIRILPHQQNTGAFFIAVLQKNEEVPWSNKRTDPVINPSSGFDETERLDPLAKDFSFGVRGSSGLYMHAKCHLCGVLLMGKHDYDSHKQGRKHTMKRQIRDEAEAAKGESKSEEQDLAAVKTETNGENTEAAESVKPETDLSAKPSESMDTGEVSEKDDKVSESDASAGDAVKKEGEDSETMETEQTEKAGQDVKAETAGSSTASDGNAEGQKKRTADEDGNCSGPSAKKMRTEKSQPAGSGEAEIPVRLKGHKEDPFYFCGPSDPIWPGIKEFYKITEGLNVEQIMYRNMKRVLYFVSKPVRELVLANHQKVKFINLGVKCFSNAPSPLVPECDYRLSQEGLLAVEKHIGARRVCLTRQDLVTILSQENPFIYKLSSQAQDDVYSMSPGSALFHFKPSESDPEPNVEIVFCGWRGKTSVRSFVAKDERTHYLRMCGVELTDIQAEVAAKKAMCVVEVVMGGGSGGAGTDTPLGIPSGDEEEVKRWNEGDEAPRGMEEDDADDGEAKTGNSEETMEEGAEVKEANDADDKKDSVKDEGLEEKGKDADVAVDNGPENDKIKKEAGDGGGE